MSQAAIRFPFAISQRGAVTGSPRREVIRQQIEQVLFTLPGERVGRPEFGCGVQRLVFEGMGAATVSAAEYAVSTTLARAMRGLIVVDAVRVGVREADLTIDILFTTPDDGAEYHVEIARPLDAPL